ncbi:MAG: hypothetical protein KID04_14460 [Clostridium sp.]|nr:hypothetical protein [Clostridium sp.]DAI95667.1 MAG TPA: hypothetical protein [Caudoviricetes sp.]
MPDYGPEHECYGCPFVCKVMTWDPTTQKEAVQNHECRASKGIRYDSTASLSLGDKCVGRIYSLDFEFLHRIREYADTLDGIDPDRYAFSSRPADYCDDGRYRLTIYPAANNKGVAAKQQLFNAFFNPDGTRKNFCPEEEKEIVLRQIQDGKREAQHIMTQYQHHNKVYFVKESDDGKFRAYFYYMMNPPSHIPIGDIPPCDADWITQKMLDDYAQKYGYEVYDPDSTCEEIPEMEQQDFGEGPEESGDSIPYPDDAPEMEQTDDPPESVNDAHADPEDLDDAENDGAEDPPEGCSWQNASSGEDDSQENEDLDEISGGEHVSLTDNVFAELIDICDGKINQALRVAVQAKESFTFSAKITFVNRGGAFAIEHDTGYQFEPIKVRSKGTLYEEIPICLDERGDPIIPHDREHQLSFDEVAPAPPAPVVTQVDGSSGLVEKVTVAEGEQLEPETDQDDQDEDNYPDTLYPYNSDDQEDI